MMDAFFLTSLGVFVAQVIFFAKQRANLNVKIDTEMKSGIEGFLEDLLKSHVEIQTEDGVSSPVLKKDFKVDDIEQGVLDLINKKKSQLKIQQKLKLYEILQSWFAYLLIPKLATFLSLCFLKRLTFNIIIKIKNVSESQLVTVDNILTIALFAIVMLMIKNLVDLASFKKL